jgi:hypothetical protein
MDVVRRTGKEIYGEKLDGTTREIRERIRGNGPFRGPSRTGEWFTRQKWDVVRRTGK